MNPLRPLLQSYMDFVRRRKPSCWLWLAPASWVTLAVVKSFDFLYRHGFKRTIEPPLPVISVGNLSYGGTNKTPFVELICRVMRSHGVRPGIVSRGYGGSTQNVRVIRDGDSDRRTVGDEPLLLSVRMPDVPVVVSRDRLDGVLKLNELGVEIAVADDAFQHRSLTRDLDIVLIDATCPFGNGRLIPAGMLREPPTALQRAHIIVLTKTDQVDPDRTAALHDYIKGLAPNARIFESRLRVMDWTVWDGSFKPCPQPPVSGIAFSAIGNPESFIHTLRAEGIALVGQKHFRDHHSYTAAEMEKLCRLARKNGAECLFCTEKDIYNMPPDWRPSLPIIVPRVAAAPYDEKAFTEALCGMLRPRLVVASNGYGEDAIGVLLAKKLRANFPAAEVLAFPLVGRGEPYREEGFTVASSPSVTPSGGVLKYHLRDIWRDVRAGLFRHIRAQLAAWEHLRGATRTPICVGDVYLLLHTLWGHGLPPLFIATAKTVYLSGHWRLERSLIRRYSRRTWTRDEDSAAQLKSAGANAVYGGNPIMDLLGDIPVTPPLFPDPSLCALVMLLPGSRQRAYNDVNLLLESAELLSRSHSCRYIMTLAPTIDLNLLVKSCRGWKRSGTDDAPTLTREGIVIRLTREDVATAARGVSLLIGLGGTANQLCAGMGIPVVSIDEKGKRVQKKLLQDAELLVEPTPAALAQCALKVLSERWRYEKMSAAGLARMGSPGALDEAVRYAGSQLGWSVRCRVCEKLRS